MGEDGDKTGWAARASVADGVAGYSTEECEVTEEAFTVKTGQSPSESHCGACIPSMLSTDGIFSDENVQDADFIATKCDCSVSLHV